MKIIVKKSNYYVYLALALAFQMNAYAEIEPNTRYEEDVIFEVGETFFEEMRYVIESKRTITLQNLQLSTGPTNTTKFSNSGAYDNGVRDSHIIDAYHGVFAWAWTDNSMIADKTNGTMNVMVVVGGVNSAGTLQVSQPINITKFTTPGLQAWDTAIAISRTNSKNMVVSYLLIDYNNNTALPYRAYTINGGATWVNGPMNVPPSGYPEVGDNRGIAADKYGNFWYLATNLYNSSGESINQPYFAVSSNGGNTFKLAYTLPLLSDFVLNTSEYDYPQFCFGGLGDGSGKYGVWFVSDYYQNGSDITPLVGFIPVNGLNSWGSGSVLELKNLVDTQYVPSLAASQDGRVWCEAINFSSNASTLPIGMRFKSPGAFSANYNSPYTVAHVSSAFADGNANEMAQPSRGFFNVTVQGNVYDEARKALYCLVTDKVSNTTQNMQINLYISRNNGKTWSAPIGIATTTNGNRGFASLALDPVTGDLVLGWYDGRNDKTYKSIEYYASYIPSATLTSLVNGVPA